MDAITNIGSAINYGGLSVKGVVQSKVPDHGTNNERIINSKPCNLPLNQDPRANACHCHEIQRPADGEQ